MTIAMIFSGLFSKSLRLEHRSPLRFEMRPADHDEITQCEELRIILPRFYFVEGISTNDVEELPCLLRVFQEMRDSFDSVRPALPPYFHIGDRERRVISDSQFNHLQAMSSSDGSIVRFVGWYGRRNEDDLIEIEGLQYFLSAAQMSNMYWIKGAPQQANFFACSSTRS